MTNWTLMVNHLLRRKWVLSNVFDRFLGALNRWSKRPQVLVPMPFRRSRRESGSLYRCPP